MHPGISYGIYRKLGKDDDTLGKKGELVNVNGLICFFLFGNEDPILSETSCWQTGFLFSQRGELFE